MKHDFSRILGRVCHWAWAAKNTKALESLRPDQIACKKWLVHEILKFGGNKFDRVAVLGSWNSILLYELLSDNAEITDWHFYDMDTQCHEDRLEYFGQNELKASYQTFDLDVTTIFDQPDVCNQYDLIINPSCEHMNDIQYQGKPLYALCSTNKKLSDGSHINVIEHFEDLAVKNNINRIEYQGRLRLKEWDWERYCTVGYVE